MQYTILRKTTSVLSPLFDGLLLSAIFLYSLQFIFPKDQSMLLQRHITSISQPKNQTLLPTLMPIKKNIIPGLSPFPAVYDIKTQDTRVQNVAPTEYIQKNTEPTPIHVQESQTIPLPTPVPSPSIAPLISPLITPPTLGLGSSQPMLDDCLELSLLCITAPVEKILP